MPQTLARTDFGITQNHFSRECVAKMGRTREASRFKLHPVSSARKSALGDGIGTAVDWLLKNKAAHSADSGDDFDGVGLAVWDADPGFPEIPTSVTDDEHWAIVGCGRWKVEDNIVRLEARALIQGIERLAVPTFGTFI